MQRTVAPPPFLALAAIAMEATSPSLLLRARQGSDPDAWHRLVDLYEPLLRNWLRRHSNLNTEADDLVQEVLAVVVKELPRFDHPGHAGAFRAWLRAILANRLRTFWRSRRGRPTATGDSDFVELANQIEDSGSALSLEWDRQHDVFVVSRLLVQMEAEFEAKSMEAFRRVTFHGQKAEEASAALGMTVAAVYIAKSRIMRRLREEARGLIEG